MFGNSGTSCQLKPNGRHKTPSAVSRGDSHGGVTTEAMDLNTNVTKQFQEMRALKRKLSKRQ